MEIDTTWSATQVGLRPVETGLGGQEEGVIGVDDGVENASPPKWKRVRTTMSECAAFSDFTGVATDVVNEKRNNLWAMVRREVSCHNSFRLVIPIEIHRQTRS